MQLDWIQVEQSAINKGRTMARLLRIPEAHGVGLAVSLIAWGVEQATERDLSGQIPDDKPAEVIAAALGWKGDAGKLYTALIRVGFVEKSSGAIEDGFDRVKGLDRYAAAAVSAELRSTKAKHAAEVRWGMRKHDPSNAQPMQPHAQAMREHMLGDAKKRQEEKRIEKEEKPLLVELVENEPTPEDLRRVWNEEKPPECPAWVRSGSGRKTAAKARLDELPLDSWREIIQRISRSSFCRGKNDRGWVADPDFLLRPDTSARVLEGKYDDKGKAAAPVREEPKCRDMSL